MQKKKRIYIVFLIKYGKNISLRFFINPSQLFRISRMSSCSVSCSYLLASVCSNFKNNVELQFNARVNIDN